MAHEHAASMDRNNFHSVNHGRPAMAAVARPMSQPISHAGGNDRPMSAQHGSGTPPNHAAGNQAAPVSHGAPQNHSGAPHNAPQHSETPHAAPQHNAPQHQQHAPPKEGHEGH
jgi:hypothetical protein